MRTTGSTFDIYHTMRCFIKVGIGTCVGFVQRSLPPWQWIMHDTRVSYTQIHGEASHWTCSLSEWSLASPPINDEGIRHVTVDLASLGTTYVYAHMQVYLWIMYARWYLATVRGWYLLICQLLFSEFDFPISNSEWYWLCLTSKNENKTKSITLSEVHRSWQLLRPTSWTWTLV